jgi:hypothetical protein
VARNVVDDLLDDVRRDADLDHPGHRGAAEIVQDPVLDLARTVELPLGLGSAGKAGLRRDAAEHDA